LLTHDLQLRDGVGTLKVGCDEQGRVPLLLEPLREFARERRLTRTLEPREHDDGRRLLRELELALLSAEDADELLVDDLHDLLGRVEGLVDLVGERTLAHASGELLRDLESDIRIQQGATDLAHRAVDIRGAELALGAEVLEGLGEPVGERAEGSHDGYILRGACWMRVDGRGSGLRGSV